MFVYLLYWLFENAVSYAKEANNLMFQPVTKTGTLAKYTAIGVIPVAANLMNANKPEEVAKLTTSGLTPLSVKVGDAIYGNVGGKDQHLGTILLSPKVSANTLSLSYAGFKSSIVTISGLGWDAGIYSSFNPSTGKITLNPKNAAWVSAGLRVQSLPNGEVIKSVIMPSGFGIGGNYNYINVSNISVSNGKWSGLESYTSLDGSSSYSLESAGSFPSAIHSISVLGGGIKSVGLITLRAGISLTFFHCRYIYDRYTSLTVPAIHLYWYYIRYVSFKSIIRTQCFAFVFKLMPRM